LTQNEKNNVLREPEVPQDVTFTEYC